MEFYKQAFYYRCRKAPVSIPNGMEFYENIAGENLIYDSFNSQRDGILPLTL